MLVLNGDVLTRVDCGRLLHFYFEYEVAETGCVREHTTQIPYDVVRTDEITVWAIEGELVLSHYVNAGIYLLAPGLLDLALSAPFFDMPQLIEKAITKQYHASAFIIRECWLDTGLPEAIRRTHQEWQ